MKNISKFFLVGWSAPAPPVGGRAGGRAGGGRAGGWRAGGRADRRRSVGGRAGGRMGGRAVYGRAADGRTFGRSSEGAELRRGILLDPPVVHSRVRAAGGSSCRLFRCSFVAHSLLVRCSFPPPRSGGGFRVVNHNNKQQQQQQQQQQPRGVGRFIWCVFKTANQPRRRPP